MIINSVSATKEADKIYHAMPCHVSIFLEGVKSGKIMKYGILSYFLYFNQVMLVETCVKNI